MSRRTREEYAKLLEAHDWYYQFSDDPRVFDRGYQERQVIIAAAKEDPALRDMLKAHLETFNTPVGIEEVE